MFTTDVLKTQLEGGFALTFIEGIMVIIIMVRNVILLFLVAV